MSDGKIVVSTTDILRLSNQIVLRNEKFGGLMLFRGRIDMHVVNKVGYDILESFRETKPVAEAIRKIQNKYNVDEKRAEADVLHFVGNALERRFLSRIEGDGA